jgi:hypothetical protein
MPYTSTSGVINVHRLHAWRQLPALAADDVGQVIGQNLSISENPPAAVAGGVHAAKLSLFAPQDAVEVRLHVIIEDSMLEWFRLTLLGDPATDEAATQDALRELANTAGGCLKRAALAEGLALTTGLPVDVSQPSVSDTARRFSLNVGTKRIVLTAEVHDRPLLQVQAGDLSEGMVPVADVYSSDGRLLATAGSRLTETTVANITNALSPQHRIVVCSSSNN